MFILLYPVKPPITIDTDIYDVLNLGYNSI